MTMISLASLSLAATLNPSKYHLDTTHWSAVGNDLKSILLTCDLLPRVQVTCDLYPVPREQVLVTGDPLLPQ